MRYKRFSYTLSTKDSRLRNKPSSQVRSNYYRDMSHSALHREQAENSYVIFRIDVTKFHSLVRYCKLLFQYLTREPGRLWFSWRCTPFSKSRSQGIIHIRYSCVRYKIPIVISLWFTDRMVILHLSDAQKRG